MAITSMKFVKGENGSFTLVEASAVAEVETEVKAEVEVKVEAKTTEAETVNIDLSPYGINRTFSTKKEIYNETSKHIDNRYVFGDNITDIVNSLTRGTSDSLYLWGQAGTGKTSVITQICARLGIKLYSAVANGRFCLQDLIGYQTIKNGEVVFEYGSLVRAIKEGAVFLLNEVDLAPADELTGLNSILEGDDFVIHQTGEIISVKNNGFKFVVTANTRGDGNSGNYVGTGQMNGAFLDRFRFIGCEYPAYEAEKTIVRNKHPNLAEEWIECIVRLANEVRMNNANPNGNSICVSYPLSTRSLLRIADILENECIEFNEEKAIIQGFAEKFNDDEKAYIMRMFRDLKPSVAILKPEPVIDVTVLGEEGETKKKRKPRKSKKVTEEEAKALAEAEAEMKL